MASTVATSAGDLLPNITFGTYRLQSDTLKLAVQQALTLRRETTGGREPVITSIDTAQLYQNEAMVAELCQSTSIKAITTKIRKIAGVDKTWACVKQSHRRIGGRGMKTTMLLHRPMPPISWKSLERAVVENMVDELGVSNHSEVDLARLLSYAKIRPIVNQIEFHPFTPNALETLAFCRRQNIRVQGPHHSGQGCIFRNIGHRSLGPNARKISCANHDAVGPSTWSGIGTIH